MPRASNCLLKQLRRMTALRPSESGCPESIRESSTTAMPRPPRGHNARSSARPPHLFRRRNDGRRTRRPGRGGSRRAPGGAGRARQAPFRPRARPHRRFRRRPRRRSASVGALESTSRSASITRASSPPEATLVKRQRRLAAIGAEQEAHVVADALRRLRLRSEALASARSRRCSCTAAARLRRSRAPLLADDLLGGMRAPPSSSSRS